MNDIKGEALAAVEDSIGNVKDSLQAPLQEIVDSTKPKATTETIVNEDGKETQIITEPDLSGFPNVNEIFTPDTNVVSSATSQFNTAATSMVDTTLTKINPTTPTPTG